MSLTYGFYNSIDGDRMYDSVQMSHIFDGIIENGVFASIGDKLMVTTSTGLTVKVGTGRAWFDHSWTYNDADILLTLDIADAILKRWDAIVLETNSEISVRANSIKVIKGTPASSPVKPSMTKTLTVNQYPLAYVYVGAGVSTLNQSMITNMVGSSACPFVTGPLSIIDTDEILVQWQSEFQLWFDAMKGQLTTDAAGNLQNQINAVVGDANPPLTTILALKTHNHTGGLGDEIGSSGIALSSITPAHIVDRARRVFKGVAEWNPSYVIVMIEGYGVTYSYHQDTPKYAHFSFYQPSDYSGIGPLAVNLVWANPNSTPSNVRWKCEYSSFKNLDQAPLMGATVITAAVPTELRKIYVTNLMYIPMNAGDDLFYEFKLTRLAEDPLDTCPNPVSVLGVEFTYLADS